jgi:type VI secretion system protein VasD
MSNIVFRALKAAAFGMLLSGCGLTQTVTDGTASTAKAIFYKQIKTLHLDLSGRTSTNTDELDMRALSVPTLVRVYQLRNSKLMDKATYESLLNDDGNALGDSLPDMRTTVIKPGEGAQLSVPMDKDAQFIVVVALLREPDIQSNTWRLTLTRDDLDPDRARVIELGDNRLTLRPLVKE